MTMSFGILSTIAMIANTAAAASPRTKLKIPTSMPMAGNRRAKRVSHTCEDQDDAQPPPGRPGHREQSNDQAGDDAEDARQEAFAKDRCDHLPDDQANEEAQERQQQPEDPVAEEADHRTDCDLHQRDETSTPSSSYPSAPSVSFACIRSCVDTQREREASSGRHCPGRADQGRHRCQQADRLR